MIDQIKIGGFLRELRKEKELTQEQLAEKFGVSSRSVSRWENGNTMPELGILVELADYYEVDIKEIIDGERKSEIMKKEEKETLRKVADYAEAEKKLGFIENKLNNPGFLAKAPEAVIAQQKEDGAKLQEKIALLKSSIEKLG